MSIARFTSASWAPPDKPAYVSDKTAVLFNLTSKISFPCKDHTKAIWCTEGVGPYFGIKELSIYSPFNGDSRCTSLANEKSYKIPVDKDNINQLTGDKKGIYYTSSTIKEIEVWKIIFKK